MKIWHLRRNETLPDGDDPWEPWFDKTFGFVIIAPSPEAARALANANSGDENRGEFMGKQTAKTNAPWLDPKYSSCEEIVVAGPERIVLADHRAAG